MRLAGLIAMGGMLTVEEWGRLGRVARARYLATLDALGLRGQASVLAVATRASIGYIIGGWIAAGYIDHARGVAAVMSSSRRAS